MVVQRLYSRGVVASSVRLSVVLSSSDWVQQGFCPTRSLPGSCSCVILLNFVLEEAWCPVMVDGNVLSDLVVENGRDTRSDWGFSKSGHIELSNE